MPELPEPSGLGRRLLVVALVGLLGLACERDRPNQDDQPKSTPASVPADQEALVGHTFLRLRGAQDIPEVFVERQRLELALDQRGNYYLGVGPRVLAYDRGAAKPYLRVIELPSPMTLLGVHRDRLILFGDDPSGCASEPCTSVFGLATSGEGAVERIAALEVESDPVLVGDQVAGLGQGALVHVSLTSGEVRRTSFAGTEALGELAVRRDELIWAGRREHALVLRSKAPFSTLEVAAELEASADRALIIRVAWAGDGIVYLVSELVTEHEGDERRPTLYRKSGDTTQTLLSEVSAAATLINDTQSAWLADRGKLWRIDDALHPIAAHTKLQFLTGTPAGLAWAQHEDDTLSFLLSGEAPSGFAPLESQALIANLPARRD